MVIIITVRAKKTESGGWTASWSTKYSDGDYGEIWPPKREPCKTRQEAEEMEFSDAKAWFKKKGLIRQSDR